MKTAQRFQEHSRKYQELVNTLTHGVGVLLSLIGLIFLVKWAFETQNIWKIISFSVFGLSLIVLYTASTAYHGARKAETKATLRKLDHMAIYISIAGSYTPFTLVTLKGAWGWSLFAFVWGIALLGIIYKFFFLGRWKKFSIVLYLLMGWSAIIASQPLIENLPQGGIIWVVLGGLSYSLGVIFFVWEKLPFNHAIWHLFVLGGSICHFFAVGWYV